MVVASHMLVFLSLLVLIARAAHDVEQSTPLSDHELAQTNFGAAPNVVVTYSPSTDTRRARMRNWLSPLSSVSWCVAELPGVAPHNFSVVVSSSSVFTADVFLKATNEHVFRLALGGRARNGMLMQDALAGKTLCSGYNHLRALRCFSGRACHPCFAMARMRWVIVLEDDMHPWDDGAPAPAVQLPSLLQAVFRGLDENTTFSAFNKIQFAVRKSANCPARCISPSLNLSQQWPQLCLRRCRGGFHDSHAYAMRRDYAEKVMGAHTILLDGSTDCEDPWYSADGSCGNDPVLLRTYFGQCSRRAKRISFVTRELSPAAQAPVAGLCKGLALGSPARYAMLLENNTAKLVTRDEETSWGGPHGIAQKLKANRVVARRRGLTNRGER